MRNVRTWFKGESVAGAAHPPHVNRGDPNHQRVRGNVMGDHAARPNEAVPTQGEAWNDRRICPNRCAATDPSRSKLSVTADRGAGVRHVREDRTRSDEDFVFENDPVVQADVVLDSAAIPNHHAARNEAILPEDAMSADARSAR